MNNSLKSTLVKYNIKIKEWADVINVTKETASLKVNGKAIVTLEEAFKTQDYIYKKTNKLLTLDEIFSNN